MGVVAIPLLVIGIIVLVVVARSLVVVPPCKAYVIERRGRFDRVPTGGTHVIPPLICRVSVRVPLDEQSIDIPAASHGLASGSEATVQGTVTFYVADPALAVTEVADYRQALATLVATDWRRAIAASDAITVVDQVRAAESSIAQAAAPWGLSIVATQPHLTLAPEAMQRLESRVAEERDARVLAWLAERRQRPGKDGRPTDGQREAYREWLDQELRVHADEIARQSPADRSVGQDQWHQRPQKPCRGPEVAANERSG